MDEIKENCKADHIVINFAVRRDLHERIKFNGKLMHRNLGQQVHYYLDKGMACDDPVETPEPVLEIEEAPHNKD